MVRRPARREAAADSSPEISAAFEAKDCFVLALETEGVGLECPGWGVAQDGRAGEGDGAVPLGNQEAFDRVGIRGGTVVMMTTKRVVDLAQSFGALHPGLAFPEHHKTLTANGATGFDGGF